jgi:Fe-S cluster biogenesis protein NfuA/nitrite reductase/ring-hydroxylating ferredoxin subunit
LEQHDDVRAVGQRVEHLLGELRAGGDPRAADIAEELVSSLVQLYGAGLRRIVDLAKADDAGDRLLTALAADPVVESLLLVHDLHPLDTDARVQRALDRVRPYLGSHAGGVEYLGVDGQGVVRLRLSGSCNGCASSAETVRLAIAQAVEEAAPETAGVHVEGVVEPPKLLQIGRRSGAPAAAPPAPAWVRLTDPAPVETGTAAVSADGTPVLLCRLGGTLYAYRDACPACRAALGGAHLDSAEGSLTCADCGARFDVHLAGAALDGADRHLVPVPLLVDADGVRLAVSGGGLVGAGAGS